MTKFILVDGGNAIVPSTEITKICICKLEKKENVEVVDKTGASVAGTPPTYAPMIYTHENKDGYVYGQPSEDVDVARKVLSELLVKLGGKDGLIE